MPYSTHVIRLLEKIEPSLREVLIAILDEIERQREETITRREFREFVRHTDENFKEVWKAIRELTEAQKRTEERMEELTEAQKRTEERMEELTEAQRKTEEELKELVSEHGKTRDIVAGLSDTVGYTLEDRIFPYIREFAKKEYGVKVEVLDRRNILYPDGRFDEVNIYIEGRKNGKKVYLIGECKARPGRREISRFSKMLKRVKEHLGAEVEGFIVGYYYSPAIEKYLRERHPEIKAMKSFEFELRYSRRVP